jgi:hypothetical protein
MMAMPGLARVRCVGCKNHCSGDCEQPESACPQ